MTLSDADAGRLASLQAALDKLASGTAIAEVEYNGERRVYAKADLATLQNEIASLSSGVPTIRSRYGTVRRRL